MSANERQDRLEELLCDRALEGLDDAATRELASLGGDADWSYDLAAAAIDLASLGPLEEPPADLRAKLLARALPEPKVVKLPTPRSRAWVGWAFAAAFALLALAAWLRRPSVLDPARDRAALIARGGDVKVVPWKATADPAGASASGDVVWSADGQRGYMRFHGLPKNDPQKTQYQLWIFDAERDDRYPVDGGVFDIDAQTGDVIVPITPKVRAHKAVLFAITIEPPGGVVVSKREHIVLTASL